MPHRDTSSLFRRFTVRSVELKNRIVMAPMTRLFSLKASLGRSAPPIIAGGRKATGADPVGGRGGRPSGVAQPLDLDALAEASAAMLAGEEGGLADILAGLAGGSGGATKGACGV